jgi:hypothetical protein
MTAVYTWDVFSTFDGYGSYAEGADWGGYWGKQGPELLEHRAALLEPEQRIVFGATTFRENAQIISGTDPDALDEWYTHAVDTNAGDGGVLHAARHPRLAGCDHRER